MTQQKENKQMGWHPNRSYLQFNGDIVLDSCFPAGNISSANIVNYNPLIIEIQGNTDISFDIQAKYWLYFRIRGYRRERSIKFIMKNANHLRKFIGQSKYRPYMVYKQDEEAWQAVPSPIQITLMENGQIQGSFTFQSQKYAKQKKINKSVHELYPSRQHKCSTGMTGDIKKGICYFATYYPYTYDDLNSFILKMTNSFPKQEPKNQSRNNNKVYFNEENLVYSYQRRKVSLITITSINNIDSFTQKQPVINQEIFPYPKDRPFKLKNCPIIMLSARVHPSETSSSFFIQGFIQFLTSNSKASMILRQLFIFQIVPMLNPDGVEHGNFRFDHQLKNLNRYYGQSSIQKTPSIRGAQLLINYFKNNCNPYSLYTIQFETSNSRLFMYVDVHGHTSAIPSFIYGNHSDKLEHMIENKLFCKLIEANFMEGGFSKQMCQFSKKNMTIQEKYDDYSKLCSGRVFAGMSQRPQQSTFHSYTMQVLPYSDEYLRRKSDNQQRVSAIQYAKCLGKSFAKSILNLLNINSQSTLNDEQIQKWKKIVHKQSMKQLSRNNFMFKRSQINERSSYSELSKPKNSIFQKQTPVYYDYSIRWFNNQSFLKSLLQRSQLINQPKICKFFSPLATKFKLQLPIYLHNFQTRHIRKHESQSKRVRVDERIFTELSDANKKAQLSGQEQKQSILIFKHKQRGRVQTKINKQNLQLNEEYIELITKMKSPEDKQKKQISNKYQYKQKNHTDITQRYQKQILLKLNDKGLNNNAIINRREKKQRKNFKSKINPRLQTETIAHQVQRQILSSQKIINLHKNTSKHLIRQKGGPNSPLQSNLIQFNPRSSFIQEFLQKGNDQKINRQFKNRCNEQLKAKMNKYQSSIKDHVEQQQKKILPVLRRNKIFTIVGSNNPIVDFNQWKCYNSIHPSRKRANTLEQQTNIEQTIFKTKKLLALHKKQEIIRQKSKNSQINYDLRL